MSIRMSLGRYPAAVLFALVLLVAHLFLMAHEPGHEEHAAHDASALAVTLAAVAPSTMPDTPTAPRSVLDGCPVAHATLPGAMLLLLLALIGGLRLWPTLTTAAQATSALLRPPPAPLPATQRRALLQVFLI